MLREFLDKDATCQLCGAKDDGTNTDATLQAVVALEHCDHRVCSACTFAAIRSAQPTSQRDYVCPVPGCSQPLPQRAVKRLLSAEDFEQFVDLELADLANASSEKGDAGALVKCPKG